MKTLGVVLVALSVLALIYGGFDYSRNRTVLRMGSMGVTASELRSVPVAGVAGLAVLIGGAVFPAMGARRGAHS